MAHPSPVLYHMPQTRAETTFWMNEELGAPCEVHTLNLYKAEHKAPDILRLEPDGQTPLFGT